MSPRNAPVLLLSSFLVGGLLLIAACSTPAPAPTPTKAPAAPAATTAPAAATAPAKAAEPTKPAAPTAAPAAKAVDFPAKGRSINIIVPVTAGGVADASARILASLMEKDLGVSMPITNKAGASSMIGMTEVANAKPDGYTLGVFLLPTTTVTYLDATMKATYTRKAFQPVALFSQDVLSVAVNPQTPFKSMKDLADAAKAAPETIKMTTNGPLSILHLGGIAFEQAAGVKFAYVHFPGGNEANTAVLGGHAEGQFSQVGNTSPHHKTGALRLLGVMDREASPYLSGVPTLESQGYKAYAYSSYGFVAPTGTPLEIVNVLAESAKKAVASQEYKDKIASVSMIPRFLGPADFDKWLTEAEEWARPLVIAGKPK